MRSSRLRQRHYPKNEQQFIAEPQPSEMPPSPSEFVWEDKLVKWQQEEASWPRELNTSSFEKGHLLDAPLHSPNRIRQSKNSFGYIVRFQKITK